MKTAFLFTMDTLSAAVIAILVGFGMACIAYAMSGPAWLVDAVGWSVFGGVGVRLWLSLRTMHE